MATQNLSMDARRIVLSTVDFNASEVVRSMQTHAHPYAEMEFCLLQKIVMMGTVWMVTDVQALVRLNQALCVQELLGAPVFAAVPILERCCLLMAFPLVCVPPGITRTPKDTVLDAKGGLLRKTVVTPHVSTASTVNSVMHPVKAFVGSARHFHRLQVVHHRWKIAYATRVTH